jgi:hypothetical protein
MAIESQMGILDRYGHYWSSYGARSWEVAITEVMQLPLTCLSVTLDTETFTKVKWRHSISVGKSQVYFKEVRAFKTLCGQEQNVLIMACTKLHCLSLCTGIATTPHP